MVNCHMLPSRVRDVWPPPRGCRKKMPEVVAGKFLFSYGKSFCFCMWSHHILMDPRGGGSLERCKEIGKAGKAVRRVEIAERHPRKKQLIRRGGSRAEGRQESSEGAVVATLFGLEYLC